MGTFIAIVGLGWALMGFVTCFSAVTMVNAKDEAGATAGGLGIIFSFFIFILPGLALTGIGWYIRQRKKSTAQQVQDAVRAALDEERRARSGP